MKIRSVNAPRIKGKMSKPSQDPRETLCASNSSTSLAKSASDRVSRSTL